MSKTARLFVVSAPSGAGKTTLCARVLRRVSGMVRSVSATTRPQRRRERQGVDYFFLSRRRFLRELERGNLLEHAVVFGNYYGTPRKFVESNLRRGNDVLLSIDVQGALRLRKRLPDKSVLIFILPPSAAELRHRLRSRGTDTAAQIQQRLLVARREMSCVPRYDYRIVNDDVRTATESLRAIVTAERCRVTRRKR